MCEWITDRLPTIEDAMEDTVLVWNGSEAILWTYDAVNEGQPWAAIHKLIAPYVKPKRWTVKWQQTGWELCDWGFTSHFLHGFTQEHGIQAQRICDIYNEVMP